MARLFSVNVFAAAVTATRCSGSVVTVIGDNAIAALPAKHKLAAISADAPIAVISRAQKDARIIATANGSTDDAGHG